MTRQFTIKQATREAVPILFGLVGPSGSGKTFSALRLATGIQRVSPGKITVIDTEHRRALHYADDFQFDHLDFGPPFSPLDYMAAIEYAVSDGARTLIIDSMSHEHEGESGVLEWHDRIVNEMVAKGKNRDNIQFGAWAEPKAARRKMKQRVIQLGCNVIFCYRAQEKIKPPDKKKGEKDMVELGWMPIGDMNLVYEFVANALLEPGCKGVPVWMPGRPGEQRFSKLPKQFVDILNPRGGPVPQLSEDIGELMARWAAGSDPFGAAMSAIRAASTQTDLESCASTLKCLKETKAVPPQQYRQLIDAWKAQQAAIESSDNDAAAGAQADGEAEVDHQESMRDPGED